MKCVNDIELMEYVANKMAPGKQEQVKKHLSECAKCSERFQESARLWETLGRWNVDTTSHNIADKVMESIKKAESARKEPKHLHIVKRRFWVEALRIAALVVIAIGLGQKLGNISAGQKTPTRFTRRFHVADYRR